MEFWRLLAGVVALCGAGFYELYPLLRDGRLVLMGRLGFIMAALLCILLVDGSIARLDQVILILICWMAGSFAWLGCFYSITRFESQRIGVARSSLCFL